VSKPFDRLFENAAVIIEVAIIVSNGTRYTAAGLDNAEAFSGAASRVKNFSRWLIMTIAQARALK